MIRHEKLPYETPLAEVFVLELKELLCESNEVDGDAGDMEEVPW